MNDNLYNPAAIGSNQPSALNANSGFSPRHFELDGYGLSRCFDDFFDKCKKINDAERTINDALRDISQFKTLLSQALNRRIVTHDDFQSAIDWIRTIVDFWTKYGEKINPFIKGEDDVQKLIDAYQQCPKLKQDVDQLQATVTDKNAQISALQESVIVKQLDEATNQLNAEKVKNANLSEEIDTLKGNISNLEEELSCSRTENKRVTDEAESLKEKLANEQSTYQDEIGKVTNAYKNKSERVEQLQNEIMTYQIIRSLIADAFKIDTRTKSEFDRALVSAKTILRACVEMGKNSPLGDNIIERIEDILKENARMREIEEDNKRKDQTIERLNKDISKKDADLYDQEQKINDSKDKIATMANDIANYQKSLTDLNESKTALLGRLSESSASLEVRNKIIQCFQDISEDIEAIVNAIENTENGFGELQKLKSILKELCIQNNRMADIDELAKANGITSIDSSSMQVIFDKFKAFDNTKEIRDIYLDFIYSLMRIRGMQWSSTVDPLEQKQLLESFSNEYMRALTLCRAFEDIKHSQNAPLDIERLEAHQAEMISALDKFHQYAQKTTNDSTLGKGITLYEKIAPLPNLQEQLSQSIESAVFSISYSRSKIEESEKLQNSLHELQLQYEKQSNVLLLLERKIYPNFMTAQNLGRRDKLIDDIEFGLANDIVQAVPLKSYLGLLSFVEKDYDAISDETLIWILQQLPKALYNFYQDTILEGATDISSDEAIYDVMNQLMNKINKFILKGSFFLSMPRLGSSISLDSMEVFEKTNSVNAVLSWMISDSRHKIIHKALVK